MIKKPKYNKRFNVTPQKAFCGIVFFIAFSIMSVSASQSGMDRDIAAHLGRVWVDYQGRISPVQTLANDFTMKLTGKPRFNDASGEQVFWGWLFYHDKWQHEPMFKINSRELRGIAGISNNRASLADFIDVAGRNKLEPYYPLMYDSNNPRGWLREAVNLNDKFFLIEMLQNGSLLKIFPMYNESGMLQWYAPNTYIPAQADSMDNIFVQHFFPHFYEALMQGDAVAAGMYVDKLLEFQQRKAGGVLPSATHLRAEQIFNRVRIFSLLFKVCLTLGSLCLLLFIFQDFNISIFKKHNISVQRFFLIALLIVFIAATIGLGLRTYIGGRFPLRGTYETMLLLAWFSMLTGLLMRRHSLLIVAFSFLLSGFTLLVAYISAINPSITPLVPVLKSPLLSVHVLTIMLAYGLCGFMTFNSITALIVRLLGGKSDKSRAYIKRMKETSELFMFPATFLMGAGIFIGAIWANMSWGRYWGWDPKEVWALITFLLMGFTFHGKTLSWFRKPLFYHIFVLIIFLSVLMTYFGVSYILGGIHSYAV